MAQQRARGVSPGAESAAARPSSHPPSLSSTPPLLQEKQARYFRRPRLIAQFPFQSPGQNLITLLCFFKHPVLQDAQLQFHGAGEGKTQCWQEGNGTAAKLPVNLKST